MGGIPLLVEHPGYPDAEVEPQAVEVAFHQHVAAEQAVTFPVHGAQNPGVGELVLAGQGARRRPGAVRDRIAGRLAADERGAGVDVPVPLGPAVSGARAGS